MLAQAEQTQGDPGADPHGDAEQDQNGGQGLKQEKQQVGIGLDYILAEDLGSENDC